MAWISKELCIGCGICVKVRRPRPPARAGRRCGPAEALRGHVLRAAQKCPFDAIMIINLPKNLEKETTHRYGPNSFKLHRRGGATPARPAVQRACRRGA